MGFDLDRVKDIKDSVTKIRDKSKNFGNKRFRANYYSPKDMGEDVTKGWVIIPPTLPANTQSGYETFPKSMPAYWYTLYRHTKGEGSKHFSSVTCLKTWDEKVCPTCQSVDDIFDGTRTKHRYPKESGVLWAYPVAFVENSQGKRVAVPIGGLGFMQASIAWYRDTFLEAISAENHKNKNDVLEELPVWVIKSSKISGTKYSYTVYQKECEPVDVFAHLSQFALDENGKFYLAQYRDDPNLIFADKDQPITDAKLMDEIESFLFGPSILDYLFRNKLKDMEDFYDGWDRERFENEDAARKAEYEGKGGGSARPQADTNSRREYKEDRGPRRPVSSGDKVPW